MLVILTVITAKILALNKLEILRRCAEKNYKILKGGMIANGIYHYTKWCKIPRFSVKLAHGRLCLSPSEAVYSDENYDYVDLISEENSESEPLPEIDWFDIHSRRKRDVISPSKAESLQYKVCVR